MEVLFFAVVAALVLGRLFQVLGQNHDGPTQINKDNFSQSEARVGDGAPVAPDTLIPALKLNEATARPAPKYPEFEPVFNSIRRLDSSFDPLVFENQVQSAYLAIIASYSTGDKTTLARLVSPHVFAVYETEMARRAEKGANKIEVTKLAEPLIKQAHIDGNLAHLSVYFAATLYEVGQKPRNSTEIWTFERNLLDKNPSWNLIATENA